MYILFDQVHSVKYEVTKPLLKIFLPPPPLQLHIVSEMRTEFVSSVLQYVLLVYCSVA